MATSSLEIAHEPESLERRILIADDQQDVLEALRLLLKGHGYATEAVTSPAALLEASARREFDLILMDMNYARDTTSGREGLDLLARLGARENAPPIIVMTGWANVGVAVEAMQRGVGDVVEKPWVNARLLEALSKQIELGRRRRAARLRAIEESRAQIEMAAQLRHQEREIEEARTIQQGFLPKDIPQLAGYAIAGAWQPAHVVGGDYFDVLPFSGQTVGLCIADVAGKGMPAAMLMSNFQAGVRGLASPALSPEILCDRLNALACRNMASDRFITFFYAALDGPSRRLLYVNAGHNAPIVMHADGSHERCSESGPVLGMFPQEAYTSATKSLAPGDRVVLFTDGVTEARDPDGVEFGEARLLALLQENRSAAPADLQQIILSAVGEFCCGNWHDDATLIVLAVEET